MEPSDRLDFFRTLAAAARQDGAVSPAERRVLEDLRDRHGATEAELATATGDPRVAIPRDRALWPELLQSCVEVVRADGILSDAEARFLADLRTRLGIPKETVRPVVRGTRALAVAILGVACLALAGLGWLGLRSFLRGREKQRFAPLMGEFTGKPDWTPYKLNRGRNPKSAEPLPSTEPPTLVGKIVLIDVDKKEVDDLQFELPDDLRARTPEEVGTVVWMKWDFSGTAVGSKRRYFQHCEMTFIRRDRWEGTGKGMVSGDLSGGKGSAVPFRGGKPEKEVLDYILGLPRELGN